MSYGGASPKGKIPCVPYASNSYIGTHNQRGQHISYWNIMSGSVRTNL